MATEGRNAEVCEKTIVTLPDMQWSEESTDLKSISVNLPKVIKHDGNTAVNSVLLADTKHTMFLYEPLLAYSVHNVTKVLAINLLVETNKRGVVKKREELGDCTVFVPQKNKLWFATIGTNVDLVSFTSVDSIPLTDVNCFLSTTPLKCKKPKENNPQLFTKKTIPAGRVLTIVRYTSGKRSDSICQYIPVGKFKKKVLKYVQCYDEYNDIIFIKLNQKGKFYAVKIDGQVVPNKCVMQMDQILSHLTFPVDVRCVFGKPPSNMLFTGFLKLRYTQSESVIIASTIKHYHNVLLEIPRDSCPMKFREAYQDVNLTTSNAYKRAVKVCSENAASYVKEIKPVSEAVFKQRTKSLPSELSNLKIAHNIPKQRTVSENVKTDLSNPNILMDSVNLPNFINTFDQSTIEPVITPPLPCCNRHNSSADSDSDFDDGYIPMNGIKRSNTISTFNKCGGEPVQLLPRPCRNSENDHAEYILQPVNEDSDEDVYTKRDRTDALTRRRQGNRMTYSVSVPVDSGFLSRVVNDTRDSTNSEYADSDDESTYMDMKCEDHIRLGHTSNSNETVVSYLNLSNVDLQIIRCMSVKETGDHLAKCGVSCEVIEKFRQHKIDGKLLTSKFMNIKSFRAICQGITDIDLSKLELVMTEGWKPKDDDLFEETEVEDTQIMPM